MKNRKGIIRVLSAAFFFLAGGMLNSLDGSDGCTLTVVGDIMVHNTQLYRAYDKTTGAFDFLSSFDTIASELSGTDFCIGNLETTLAGPDGMSARNDEQYYKGYQGYPWFNSPDALLQALIKSGFNVLTTSNNHSLDSGIKGLEMTYKKIKDSGIAVTGTGIDNVRPIVLEKGGLTAVLVSYTYGTNGIKVSPENLHKINSLQNYSSERIEQMFSEVKCLNTLRNGIPQHTFPLSAGDRRKAVQKRGRYYPRESSPCGPADKY